MLILGSVKQLTQDAVVQVDDFVGDGGHALGGQRHESGVAPLRLEFGVLGIFRPKTTKCSGGPAVCGLQRGITFFEIPIWALFE